MATGPDWGAITAGALSVPAAILAWDNLRQRAKVRRQNRRESEVLAIAQEVRDKVGQVVSEVTTPEADTLAWEVKRLAQRVDRGERALLGEMRQLRTDVVAAVGLLARHESDPSAHNGH